MTINQFDKVVWIKGIQVNVTNSIYQGITGKKYTVIAVEFDNRAVIIEVEKYKYLRLKCVNIELEQPTEQLPGEKVNELINRSMWDNDCPNPEEL